MSEEIIGMPTNAKEAIEVIRKIFKNLNEENAELREKVVWGFYEDLIPTYKQGIGGEHELTSPVTATEVNTMLWDLIEAIRVLKAVSDWANDLGYYSDAGTELAPVFQKVNGFLETEIAKRLLAGLDETAK